MCLLKVTSGAGLSAEAPCAEADAWAATTPAMAQVNGTTAASRRRCRFIAGGYAQSCGSSIKGVGDLFLPDLLVLGRNSERRFDQNPELSCFTSVSVRSFENDP